MTEFHILYPKSAAGKAAWNKAYGLNAYYSGKHWSIRKRDAEFWHLQTISAINRLGIRYHPYQRPVKISFFWDDKMDIDNHAVIGKMIVDALKGILIVDDTRKYLRKVSHEFSDDGFITVKVEEINDTI